MSGKLHSEVVELHSIGQSTKVEMFAIYAHYYKPAFDQVFFSDLNSKSHVLLLFDDAHKLRGFSTLKTWKLEHDGKHLQIIFSGDTIIEREFWGYQTLPFNWIEFAGIVKAQTPTIPLYWLLITKGHRTYRYMSVFSREFFPRHGKSTPASIRKLMDQIGKETFPNRYCKDTGIVKHTSNSAALKKEFQSSQLNNKANKEIDFFFSKNPEFESGDELLCLCELSTENLRPMARKQFEKGLKNHVMEEAT